MSKKMTFDEGVTLLGGGPVSSDALEEALTVAPRLICADGGARHLAGRKPDGIVGDLDSLEDVEGWRAALGERLIHFPDQDDTDFQKCLRAIAAPFFIGVGFQGGRVDHSLAALSALLEEPRPIALLSEDDVIVAAGRAVDVETRPGERISIYPLRDVVVENATGLRWPATGLHMASGGRIGTSNEATGASTSLRFDAPGALLIGPRAMLVRMLAAVRP